MNKLNKKLVEKKLVIFLDLVSENRLEGFKIENTATLRRILFFKFFLANRGNATKAAILAGYSQKSAKQQGYRILKWLKNEIT